MTAELLDRVKSIFFELCETQDCMVIEFNGESDHVHLLFDISPSISISELVKILKSGASPTISKEFPDHLKRFYYQPVFWSGSSKGQLLWWRSSSSRKKVHPESRSSKYRSVLTSLSSPHYSSFQSDEIQQTAVGTL